MSPVLEVQPPIFAQSEHYSLRPDAEIGTSIRGTHKATHHRGTQAQLPRKLRDGVPRRSFHRALPFPYRCPLGRRRAASSEAAKCARKTPPAGEGGVLGLGPIGGLYPPQTLKKICAEIRDPPPLSGKALPEICKKNWERFKPKTKRYALALSMRTPFARRCALVRMSSPRRVPEPRRQRQPRAHEGLRACDCHHGGEALCAKPFAMRAPRPGRDVHFQVLAAPRLRASTSLLSQNTIGTSADWSIAKANAIAIGIQRREGARTETMLDLAAMRAREIDRQGHA